MIHLRGSPGAEASLTIPLWYTIARKGHGATLDHIKVMLKQFGTVSALIVPLP